MNYSDLPDEDHVVRYVKPSLVGKSHFSGAFLLRSGENGLSVNWLEIIEGNDDHRVNEVRRLSRLNLSKNGRFAKFNIGATKFHVMSGAEEAGIPVEIIFVHAPLSSTSEYEADPSHAVIKGIPQCGSDEEMVISDLFSECIVSTFDGTND